MSARDIEVARDAAFEQLVDARIDALLHVRSGGAYLDVGCGTGDDTRTLAEMIGPAGRAVGVDTNAELLARALRLERSATKRGGRPASFAAADAHRLPFQDAAFSGARAERLLLHAVDPFVVVQEMARVTESGGVVVVCEVDWGAAVVAGADLDWSRTILNAWGKSVRHGFIGRRLPGLLREAGLVEVGIETFTDVTTLAGYDSARNQQEWDVSVGARIAVESGAISAENAERWLAQLDEAVGNGSFLMAITCFLVSGRKAGGTDSSAVASE